jgi:hypothetical protein
MVLDEARVLELARLSGRPPFETVAGAEAQAVFLRGRVVFVAPAARRGLTPAQGGGRLPAQG